MKFRPLGERALVKMAERGEETTESGIVLPDTAKERPQIADVVAVGNGLEVSEGDTVMFAKYAGTEIKLDGEDYMILDAEDILGIVQQ